MIVCVCGMFHNAMIVSSLHPVYTFRSAPRPFFPVMLSSVRPCIVNVQVSASLDNTIHNNVGETGASCYNFHSNSIFHTNMQTRKVTYFDFNVVLVCTCFVSHTVSTCPTIFVTTCLMHNISFVIGHLFCNTKDTLPSTKHGEFGLSKQFGVPVSRIEFTANPVCIGQSPDSKCTRDQ